MSYIGSTPTSQNFIAGTDYFNGDGSTTAFTLTRTVNSVNDIEAVINNVVQRPNDAYTISGTTITFTSAPSAGTGNIYVRYLSTTTQSITPSQGTVGTPQLAALTTLPVVGGYTATLPAATGTVMVSGNMPAFSAYKSSNQSITSNTWTKVTFNTEEFDTNNNFSSSTFTPTVAGYYQVNAILDLGGTGVTFTLSAFYKNGGSFKYIGFVSNTAEIVHTGSYLVYMNGTTDYLEVYAYITASSPTVYGGSTAVAFSGSLVRTA